MNIKPMHQSTEISRCKCVSGLRSSSIDISIRSDSFRSIKGLLLNVSQVLNIA